MASDSRLVVWAALAGNVLVGVSKYGAAAISGSSAMLAIAGDIELAVFSPVELEKARRQHQTHAGSS
jgi:hypothetical protein